MRYTPLPAGFVPPAAFYVNDAGVVVPRLGDYHCENSSRASIAEKEGNRYTGSRSPYYLYPERESYHEYVMLDGARWARRSVFRWNGVFSLGQWQYSEAARETLLGKRGSDAVPVMNCNPDDLVIEWLSADRQAALDVRNLDGSPVRADDAKSMLRGQCGTEDEDAAIRYGFFVLAESPLEGATP